MVVLFLVILGCSCPKLADLSKGSRPSPSPSNDWPTPAPTPAAKTGNYNLTMDNYNQLSIGMPRARVEDLLGGKGTEISSSTGGGIRFTVNKWEGENFKSIILSFRNDKIMSKSQVGLK